MPADLSLLQYDKNTGLTMRLSRPYGSGAYASGVQKLAQQFIAELMTLTGSVRFDPDYGCSFIDDIRSRNASAIADIQRALSMSIGRVVTNMRRRDIGNEPLDELLRTVSVTSLIQNLDQVIASLEIQSESGDSVTLKLPLDLLN